MKSGSQPAMDGEVARQLPVRELGRRNARRRMKIIPVATHRQLASRAPGLPESVPRPASLDLSFERAVKRLFDICGALALMVLFSPILVLVLLGAAVNGHAPFFRQRRVGRDGRLFSCLKFQTMVPDAEAVLADLLARDPELRAEWDRNQKLRNDPRVTPIGRFLRSCSLDELPQLWNVLKGEMSLVGPRPIMLDQQLLYGRSIVVYMLVRPGMTGLWQVSGRNLLDFRKRMAMDILYVRNQSLVLDIWILLKTIVVVVTQHGAY